MKYEIDVSDRQQSFSVDCAALRAAVRRALEIEQVAAAVLSISIVDNRAIHILNRDHLRHDYATDVISFQLDFRSDPQDDGEGGEDEFDESAQEELQSDESGPAEPVTAHVASEFGENSSPLRASGALIEGEIVASAEMAAERAAEAQWSAQAELTLYVIHGMLHICGYDDQTPEDRTIMRSREDEILLSLGLKAAGR